MAGRNTPDPRQSPRRPISRRAPVLTHPERPAQAGSADPVGSLNLTPRTRCLPRAVLLGQAYRARSVAGGARGVPISEEHPVPGAAAPGQGAPRHRAVQPAVDPRAPMSTEPARSRALVSHPARVEQTVPMLVISDTPRTWRGAADRAGAWGRGNGAPGHTGVRDVPFGRPR